MQDYLRGHVKPANQRELIDGVRTTVDVNKCRRYIGHLKKVIPKVIDLEGAATGYTMYIYLSICFQLYTALHPLLYKHLIHESIIIRA